MRFFIRILIAGFAAIVLGIMVIALKFVADDAFDSPLWPFDGIIAIVIGIGLIGWSVKEIKNKDKS